MTQVNTVTNDDDVRFGYWRFDGQVRWFVGFAIPLTVDKSWRFKI